MTMQFKLETVFFIWRRIGDGYDREFLGTVAALDAYAAARLARRQFGPGRYQIRESKWGAPVLAHA